jgi:hypothetical protein
MKEACTTRQTVKQNKGTHLWFGILTAILLTTGASAQTRSLQAIATLKFYSAAQGISFPVGANPSAVLFDGSSVWWRGSTIDQGLRKRRTFCYFPDSAANSMFDGTHPFSARTQCL